jgi:hypothetical protein
MDVTWYTCCGTSRLARWMISLTDVNRCCVVMKAVIGAQLYSSGAARRRMYHGRPWLVVGHFVCLDEAW